MLAALRLRGALRLALVPLLPLAALPAAAAPPSAARRGVGTQTPRWRARVDVAAKLSAAVAARQAQWDAAPSEADSLLIAGEGSTAEALAAKIHAAAARRLSDRCLRLTWSLRDMVRDHSVHEAINKFRASEGREASTLLLMAAREGFADSVDLLLEMQADTRLKTALGATPLHLAACSSDKTVSLLLSKGRSHTEARDAQGRTALHIAALLGNSNIAGVLLGFGARLDALDVNGKTPVDVAATPRLAAQMAKYVNGRRAFERQRDEPHVPSMVAPKLVMTAVGYCPEIDGKVVMLAKGIRVNKGRKGPNKPGQFVNWYSPRG